MPAWKTKAGPVNRNAYAVGKVTIPSRNANISRKHGQIWERKTVGKKNYLHALVL